MTNIANRSSGFISAVITMIGLVSSTVFPALPFQARAASADNPAPRNYARPNRLAEADVPKSLSFESNQGQNDSYVKFISRAEGFSLFLTADGAVMQFGKAGGSGLGLNSKKRASSLRMTLAGGNSSAPMEGIDQIAARSNYIIGNDPKKWRTNLSSYSKVKQPKRLSGH